MQIVAMKQLERESQLVSDPWASKMARLTNELVAKPAVLSLSHRTSAVKEKTDSHKLSFDVYIYTVACVALCPHTHKVSLKQI